MAADGFDEDRHRVRTFEKHVLPQRAICVAGKNRLFPDHAFGPRCVGGWGAEVNSGRSCRKSWQGRGFARGIFSLRQESQPDWRASSTPKRGRLLDRPGLSWFARRCGASSGRPLWRAPHHEGLVSSSRAAPRSARPAARQPAAARPGAARSARRCGSRCRARTGTS